MLDRFQKVLDRINAKAGDVGSLLAVLFWSVILALALWHMIEQS